jgi:Mg-chelatase subunit ChlD/Pyruvate/2-oxoacid:ferredoxin oxidoreductase delta subunit
MNTHGDTILTSLLSNDHGRERRAQRGIEKVDLQRAKKYGLKEKAYNGCYKYTYGGVVFIYDHVRKREVTSYMSSDKASLRSGTLFCKPVELESKEIDVDMINKHSAVRETLLKDKRKWTSHSVLVVDMSGSMRRDDVNGAKCRADGVWTTLARDYIKIPLENGTRTSSDLISIIVMQDEAKVLLICEPTDWCLYNRLVDYRNWTEMKPSGHGNYLPALEKANELLSLNTTGTCALALLFLSDGRPSDPMEDHTQKLGEMASQFGRRLTVSCIGMASPQDNESFKTLQDMATEAESYGSTSSFTEASCNIDSLSKLVSSLSASLTQTQFEMTDLDSGKAMKVRSDLRREKKGAIEDQYLNDNWRVFSDSSVGTTWTWSYHHNDFVELFDFRCFNCNIDTRIGPDIVDTSGLMREAIICRDCKGCCFCSRSCYNAGIDYHRQGLGSYTKYSCDEVRNLEIEGRIVKKHIPSYSLAIKNQIFGEGAERVVRKLRYLDRSGSFLGSQMVAKDSRYVLARHKGKTRFHATFMRTQSIASGLAIQFNEALSVLTSTHFGGAFERKDINLPQIRFLEPLVTQVVNDKGKNDYYLIESFLEGKYTKFNSNNGYVKDQIEDSRQHQQEDRTMNSGIDLAGIMYNLKTSHNLGTIGEEEEEEDDEEDEGRIYQGMIDKTISANPLAFMCRDIDACHIPQAFSHYTFEKSSRTLIVVDLQGVFDASTNIYHLTDPVVHRRHKKAGKVWDMGRTDRKEAGVKAFFETHRCSDVCRILGLRPVDVSISFQRIKHKHDTTTIT